ncbi:hypothetical protein GCM10022397_33040 [Flavivirga jejuensis]
MGALNIDAIAPAAAQPIKSILVFVFIWNKRAALDPKADPTLTAGPCKPTDPPKPTVKGAVINAA